MLLETFEVSTNHFGVEMNYILHVKDHFTKLSYLIALSNKTSKVISHELNHLFSFIGIPVILHSDNERVLINSNEVMNTLIELNPVMKMLKSSMTDKREMTEVQTVTGRSRTPRDQGSVEVGNKFAKQILTALR